jgi:hypothetical protein
VKAIKLFLTPEDLDDPVNRAKKYFLQTGIYVSLPHPYVAIEVYNINSISAGRYH